MRLIEKMIIFMRRIVWNFFGGICSCCAGIIRDMKKERFKA